MILLPQTTKAGFSLVETLVAISILLLVVTGPMTISMRTAKSATFATEQVQAFFLAQEGVELAQKYTYEYFLRYFNGTAVGQWGAAADAVFTSCLAAAGCGLQWGATAGVLQAPVSCAGSCLLYRSTSGRSYFTHTALGNTPTIFTRRIYFSDHVPNEKVRVRSVVTWRTGSLVAEQRVEVDTYLYNEYGTP